MSNDSVEVTEVVKVDLPEPLIYANADEFHVKSTVVYAAGEIAETGGNLYLDKALTKPVYGDKLERLFLAGGLKIAKIDPNSGALLMSIPAQMIVDPSKNTIVRTIGNNYVAHVHPTEDSLPSGPALDVPGQDS